MAGLTIPSWLEAALTDKVFVGGGYPLFLMGGAPNYDDIDIYPLDWESFYSLYDRWQDNWSGNSPQAIHFVVYGEKVQVVKPHPSLTSHEDFMRLVDINVCAAALTRSNGELKLHHLYREDVRHRRAKVLRTHEWTEYRKAVYVTKGYTFDALPLPAQ